MAKKVVNKKENINDSLSVGNLEHQHSENAQPMARTSKKKSVASKKIDDVPAKGNDTPTENIPVNNNIQNSEKKRKKLTDSQVKASDFVDKDSKIAVTTIDNKQSTKTKSDNKSKKSIIQKDDARPSNAIQSKSIESEIVGKEISEKKIATNNVGNQKQPQKASSTLEKESRTRAAATKKESRNKTELKKSIDINVDKSNKNKKISIPENIDTSLNQKKVQQFKNNPKNQKHISQKKEPSIEGTIQQNTAETKSREARQQSKKVFDKTPSQPKEKSQPKEITQTEKILHKTTSDQIPLSIQPRRKKKKKSRNDNGFRREAVQNTDNVIHKQTTPVNLDSKKSQDQKSISGAIDQKSALSNLVKGGKHSVASLEAPERKNVVLQLPSKKQNKQNKQKNIQEKQSLVVKDTKESGQNTTQQKSNASSDKHKETLSENVEVNHQTLEEKSSVLAAKEIEQPKKKDKNKKNKRNEKGEKHTDISQHQKQNNETAPAIAGEPLVAEKVMQLHENDQQINEGQIAGYEKKNQYSKPYNLIPLPKPELTKKKQIVKHKIPLPLKVGNYNDIAESVIKKVEHFLSVELCIPAGSSLLLAVSGGVDSIVMSDIFCVIAHRLHYDVQLCHINHKLRGRESDDDERSVKGFAKRCGLRIHSAHVHVQEYSKKNKISIETAARILRYNALDKQARSCGAEYVVTAHTADDAAETFLMNLFRGSGITGLTGIPIERPLSKKVNIIRPMISLRKDEIISYAQERGLFWREDSSNTSLLFTRNKIRLQLLPQLRELFGVSVVETIHRTASLMQGVDEVMENILSVFMPRYVHQVEPGAYAIELIGLSTQSEFVKGEIFQSVLVQKLNQQNQSLATIKRITQLVTADVNTCVDVNGQIVAVRERDSIILTKRKKHFDYYNTITLNGELVEQEWILRLSVLHKKPKEWSNNPLVEYFDADLLPKLLQVRSWRDGDKFQPIGMKGHTTVSDFLTNNKTRAFERKKVLVLCAGSEIVWIIGKRISECFKVSDSTQDIIKAEFILRSVSDNEEKEKK